MENFSIVVAFDKNRGIGKNGGLPWQLSKDLKHFKEVTMQKHPSGNTNAVIMGRKTWESLPERFRPLPGRINVVLTKQSDYTLPVTVITADSLDSVEKKLKSVPHGYLFIIGGQQIFEAVLKEKRCGSLYVTHIDGVFDCDTFFPLFDDGFVRIEESPAVEEGQISYRFVQYDKR
jgi:dihydrofolate reductase/thymidylate synthase